MLARIRGLKVPARTSSFAYKGRSVDVRQIARDLQVGSVLEGSVRSAGERIRVTAQLIDATSGYHIWSESYDRQYEDLFKLQDELAGAIVRALRVSLDGASQPSVSSAPPTTNLEAYHLYLQAQAMAVGAGEWPIRRAMELLQDAVARDPHFARAYNTMAMLRAVAIIGDIPSCSNAGRRRARRAARDAARPEPRCGPCSRWGHQCRAREVGRCRGAFSSRHHQRRHRFLDVARLRSARRRIVRPSSPLPGDVARGTPLGSGVDGRSAVCQRRVPKPRSNRGVRPVHPASDRIRSAESGCASGGSPLSSDTASGSLRGGGRADRRCSESGRAGGEWS